MFSRLEEPLIEPDRLRLWVRRRKQDTRCRFILFAVAANIVGFLLVQLLSSKGVGSWLANESVSKGMAPVGLALNTLALTGRLKPTLGQATKWTMWWIPSAAIGAVCTGFVVSSTELGALECRVVSGALMFPIDYSVKRFVVYSRATIGEVRDARLRKEAAKAEADSHVMLMRTGKA